MLSIALDEIALDGKKGCTKARLRTLLPAEISAEEFNAITTCLQNHPQIQYHPQKELYIASDVLRKSALGLSASKTTFLSPEQYDILEIIGREREKGILQLDIPKKLKVENYQYHIKVLLKFELIKSIRILCPFTLLLVLQRYFPFLNKVKTLKDTIADKINALLSASPNKAMHKKTLYTKLSKTAKIKQVRLTVKQAITDGFLQLDDDDMIHLISPIECAEQEEQPEPTREQIVPPTQIPYELLGQTYIIQMLSKAGKDGLLQTDIKNTLGGTPKFIEIALENLKKRGYCETSSELSNGFVVNRVALTEKGAQKYPFLFELAPSACKEEKPVAYQDSPQVRRAQFLFLGAKSSDAERVNAKPKKQRAPGTEEEDTDEVETKEKLSDASSFSDADSKDDQPAFKRRKLEIRRGGYKELDNQISIVRDLIKDKGVVTSLEARRWVKDSTGKNIEPKTFLRVISKLFSDDEITIIKVGVPSLNNSKSTFIELYATKGFTAGTPAVADKIQQLRDQEILPPIKKVKEESVSLYANASSTYIVASQKTLGDPTEVESTLRVPMINILSMFHQFLFTSQANWKELAESETNSTFKCKVAETFDQMPLKVFSKCFYVNPAISNQDKTQYSETPLKQLPPELKAKLFQYANIRLIRIVCMKLSLFSLAEVKPDSLTLFMSCDITDRFTGTQRHHRFTSVEAIQNFWHELQFYALRAIIIDPVRLNPFGSREVLGGLHGWVQSTRRIRPSDLMNAFLKEKLKLSLLNEQKSFITKPEFSQSINELLNTFTFETVKELSQMFHFSIPQVEILIFAKKQAKKRLRSEKQTWCSQEEELFWTKEDNISLFNSVYNYSKERNLRFSSYFTKAYDELWARLSTVIPQTPVTIKLHFKRIMRQRAFTTYIKEMLTKGYRKDHIKDVLADPEYPALRKEVRSILFDIVIQNKNMNELLSNFKFNDVERAIQLLTKHKILQQPKLLESEFSLANWLNKELHPSLITLPLYKTAKAYADNFFDSNAPITFSAHPRGYEVCAALDLVNSKKASFDFSYTNFAEPQIVMHSMQKPDNASTNGILSEVQSTPVFGNEAFLRALKIKITEIVLAKPGILLSQIPEQIRITKFYEDPLALIKSEIDTDAVEMVPMKSSVRTPITLFSSPQKVSFVSLVDSEEVSEYSLFPKGKF